MGERDGGGGEGKEVERVWIVDLRGFGLSVGSNLKQ